jgi:hypothetical protein
MKESAMFTVTQVSRSTQRVICMLMAAVIVTASLSVAVISAQSALHEGYSVTITQLQ